MIHEYELVILGDEGNEYYCPTCERRVVIAHNNPYKKIVLVEGDTSFLHASDGAIVPMAEIDSDVCPICHSDIGHRINCPNGIAFTKQEVNND